MSTEPERARTVRWSDPLAAAASGAALAGIDYLRMVASGESPPPPFALLLGMEWESVGDGIAVFTIVPEEFHYNPIGVVHGGVALTLCDSAIGCAVHSQLAAGQAYTSLETKVNFVRPITRETGRVRCEGKVVHAGRRIATGEARVTDLAGKLYAHAVGTCMITS